jgi:deazaflavin-dependent oxidoreductase (nitroreductase family)
MSNELAARTEGIPSLEDQVSAALRRGHVIDITTVGRRTGQPRRIEIVFHNIDGRLYITGMPRPETRAWLRNLRADPRLTIHLKGSVRADLPATSREVTDDAERRAIFTWVVSHAWHQQDVEVMTRESPLIEVSLVRPAA